MARRLTFTTAREPIEVEIGGHVYHAPAMLSPERLAALLELQGKLADLDVAKIGGREAINHTMQLVADIFDLLLTADSATHMRMRLTGDDDPVDLNREALPAITALVEEYTDRPTQPPSPSSNGSTNDGGSSTAGAPPTASTPSTLTPEGFSTSPTT